MVYNVSIIVYVVCIISNTLFVAYKTNQLKLKKIVLQSEGNTSYFVRGINQLRCKKIRLGLNHTIKLTVRERNETEKDVIKKSKDMETVRGIQIKRQIKFVIGKQIVILK